MSGPCNLLKETWNGHAQQISLPSFALQPSNQAKHTFFETDVQSRASVSVYKCSSGLTIELCDCLTLLDNFRNMLDQGKFPTVRMYLAFLATAVAVDDLGSLTPSA